MTYNDPSPDNQARIEPPPRTDPTEPFAPPPYSAATAAPLSYPLPGTAADEYLEDDDEEWVNQAPKGLRVPALTGLLVLLLFAVVGLYGGSILQKHQDNKTITSRTAAALTTALAGRRGAAGTGTAGATGGTGGTGGFGGFGGAGGAGGTGGRTLGTVTDVEGSTVFVTDSTGAVVKVNLAPTTKVTKTTTGSASDIAIGQTVVVAGTKAADGTTTASTVTISGALPTGGTGGTGAAGAGAGTTGGG